MILVLPPYLLVHVEQVYMGRYIQGAFSSSVTYSPHHGIVQKHLATKTANHKKQYTRNDSNNGPGYASVVTFSPTLCWSLAACYQIICSLILQQLSLLGPIEGESHCLLVPKSSVSKQAAASSALAKLSSPSKPHMMASAYELSPPLAEACLAGSP
eukprot:1885376-Pleurochrysis_carterae.AAC.2